MQDQLSETPAPSKFVAVFETVFEAVFETVFEIGYFDPDYSRRFSTLAEAVAYENGFKQGLAAAGMTPDDWAIFVLPDQAADMRMDRRISKDNAERACAAYEKGL